MAWCLVTPANRGIGFALTRHLLTSTQSPVLATTRRDATTVKASLLRDLPNIDPDRLTVLELDVTDEPSISAATAAAKTLFPSPVHHLRLAFTVPGILYPERSPLQINSAHALETFKVNTLGPLLLLKHFSKFLPTQKTAMGEPSTGLPPQAVYAMMSARVGSTSDNSLGGWYSYRASKAGVNSLAKTFDLWLRNGAGDKAMSVALHPGTVKTGLSKEFWGNVKEEKLFTSDFAAERLLDVVRKVGLEGRGRCWDWQGKEILP